MIEYISKYSAFTTNALKEKYTYRFKALMWSLSTLFNMLVQYYLWRSVYEEVNGNFLGVTQGEYLVYISFGVVFYNVISCMENMNIAEDIKSGNIAMNLCKPINYKTMVFFRHLGSKAGEFIGLIPLILVAFLLTNNTSFDLFRLALFSISTLFAFLLMFSFYYMVGIFTFWTTNYWGIQFFTNSIMGLFSGQLVAIEFFHQLGSGEVVLSGLSILQNPFFTTFFTLLEKLAYCLPFQSMYYTPMSILSGIIKTPRDIGAHIVLQIIWLLVLNILTAIMWKRAQRKIMILGG